MLTKLEFLELTKKYPRGYTSTLRFKHPDLIEFLDKNYTGATIGEKLYKWTYPESRSVCKFCDNTCNFKQFDHGYFEFCSCSCRAKYNKSHLNGLTPESISKRNDWRENRTQLEIEDQKRKFSETKLARYGSLNIPRSPDFFDTLDIKRYGPETHSKLSNREWLEEQYKTKTIQQIGNEVGVTYEIVSKFIKRFDLKTSKTKKFSKQELELSEFIRHLGISDIERNVKKLLVAREVDIFIPSLNLAFEFCGSYWHSDSNKLVPDSRKHKKYHQQKFLDLKEKGIKLITIFDIDWNNNKDVIKSRIENLCGKIKTTVYARKCNIVELSKKEYRTFFETCHSQGNSGATICYGLKYEGDLVAAMSFRKPRFNKKIQWEIIRFANFCGMNIVGAASKLFKNFIRCYDPESVISYSDNCWGFATVYEKMGFEFGSITPPSYYYVDIQKLSKKYHRSTFMKHKILERGGDPDLTEQENMKKLGYFRIWDCGTATWIWKK